VQRFRQSNIYKTFFRPLRISLIPLEEFFGSIKKLRDSRVCNILAKSTYVGDGFITRNYSGGFINAKLERAWNSSYENMPIEIREWNRDIKYRAHLLTWAANQAKEIPGDFVELGVFYGHLSNVILNYHSGILSRRKFFW